MIVSYGGNALVDSQVEWVESTTVNRDERRNKRSRLRRVTLRGFVKGDTQADLKDKIDAIKTTFTADGGDLILYHNDGTTVSSHTLTNAGSLSGVLITSGPDFPSGGGVEYATERNYSVTLECEYPVTNLDGIVAWQEQVRIVGTGGPRRVGVEFLTGAPEIQIVNQQTLMYASQTGSGVGYESYPFFPGPLAALAALENVDKRSEQVGTPSLMGTEYRNYPIAWAYEFMGATVPAAFPTVR